MFAGVHRSRHLAKHLPAVGWNPIVLCVDEVHHSERLDPSLDALVPDTLEVIKVPALAARLTRKLGVGDISLRAWWPLRQSLVRLLSTRRVDAILITGAPYYSMLLAPQIKRQFGIPVVLDFQDPWVSQWGAAQPAFSKAGLSHRFATLAEPYALRGAAFVTGISDNQNNEMAERYPWFDRSRMAAIPIGGDPEDFVAARAKTLDNYKFDESRINLSYVGAFWPRAEGPFRALMRAFAVLRARSPNIAARIQLNFFGTSNYPNDISTYRVRPLAEAEGVADAVREVPGRLAYLEALGVLARSQGILLIGSDEPHYSASKIYPALMSGRPYLSLYHEASSANHVLSAAGGGRVITFQSEIELSKLEGTLAEGLLTLAYSSQLLGTVNPSAYAPFEAKNISKKYGEIFDRLATEHSR
jgi:hypothetical protein